MTDELLDRVGPAAPPRDNGELAFDAPWQPRLFGMTLSLVDGGVIEWTEFRDGLIAEIGRWDASHQPGDDYHYWDHWRQALETLLDRTGDVAGRELTARSIDMAARPAGHDHDH